MEVFKLKGETTADMPHHEHSESCGCGAAGHQGDPGPPAPARPKPVGFLQVMQTGKKSALATAKLSIDGPTKKPKKKSRDWAAEIRKAREAGEAGE